MGQVGTYFVGQYYQVLQNQPDFVHQFYSEASTMIRIDGNNRDTASAMLVYFSFSLSLFILLLTMLDLDFVFMKWVLTKIWYKGKIKCVAALLGFYFILFKFWSIFVCLPGFITALWYILVAVAGLDGIFGLLKFWGGRVWTIGSMKETKEVNWWGTD